MLNFVSKAYRLAKSVRTLPITGIIFHATAGHSAESSLEWLEHTGNSYHYIIERDGRVYIGVPKEFKANHGGNSYGWREQQRGVSRRQDEDDNFIAGCSVNGYTIGIAFANMDDGEKLTEAQLQAANELARELKRKVPSIQFVSTHYIVSPGRKTDPAAMVLDSTFAGIKVWKYG